MAQAKAGEVLVHYAGSAEDGTIFGFSHEDQPLEFAVGEERILPSFENAFIGINEGD